MRLLGHLRLEVLCVQSTEETGDWRSQKRWGRRPVPGEPPPVMQERQVVWQESPPPHSLPCREATSAPPLPVPSLARPWGSRGSSGPSGRVHDSRARAPRVREEVHGGPPTSHRWRRSGQSLVRLHRLCPVERVQPRGGAWTLLPQRSRRPGAVGGRGTVC